MQHINIKYFGAIAEHVSKTEEAFEIDGDSIQKEILIDKLSAKYPGLSQLSFQVAVNRKFTGALTLSVSDEVALLPPFSGG